MCIRDSLSRAQYEDSIAGLLAGRIAEELIFNQPSTVSSNDLERVTKTAKAMVTRFGMSDVIGPMQLQHGDVNPFMGMELGQQRGYSEDIARKIDQEVRRIVESAYVRSREILVRRKDQLVLVAETLLEKEVIDRQEFIKLIGGEVARGHANFWPIVDEVFHGAGLGGEANAVEGLAFVGAVRNEDSGVDPGGRGIRRAGAGGGR